MARVKKKIGRSWKHVTKSTVLSTVEYQSSDLEIDIDVDEIAKALSDAGVTAVVQGIRAIGKPTKDGEHPQFKNTGTLVNGITAHKSGTGDAEVVAPPDRLQEQVVFERMVELVPVLREPLGAVGAQPIHDAIEKATRDVVKAGR